MKSILLQILVFLTISFSSYANDNYYIRVRNNSIEVGEYIGNRHKISKHKNYNISNINYKEIKSFFGLMLDSNEVLFYIHGIQAHDRYSQKYALKRLEKLNSVNKTISIIWKPKNWIYKRAWEKALHQGENLEQIVSSIINNNNRYNVLCHSMGSRIFEGIMKSRNDSIQFNNVFFAAPDLEINVFKNNLNYLEHQCKYINIYSNQRDIMLRMSKKIHKNERLGLNIIEHKSEFEIFKNISIINVTNSNSRRKDRFTKHSYWMKNPNVLNHIDKSLNDSSEKQKYFILN